MTESDETLVDALTVREAEHGLVRVFVLVRPVDMPRGQVLSIEQIAGWLGVGSLQQDDVQQFWTDDLDDMSLGEFLAEGYGISKDDLARHEAALEGVMDMHPTALVLVRSPAFADRPVTLRQEGPLYLVATLQEPDANVVFRPLPGVGARGAIEDPPQKPQRSDAAMSGRIATLALLVLFALVAVMVWIGG